jgi:hypothetical protein
MAVVVFSGYGCRRAHDVRGYSQRYFAHSFPVLTAFKIIVFALLSLAYDVCDLAKLYA